MNIEVISRLYYYGLDQSMAGSCDIFYYCLMSSDLNFDVFRAYLKSNNFLTC